MVRSYRDLEVWQLGLDLAEAVYKFTSTFPKSELFGLTTQMRRAAVSIPCNIAEGRSRTSSKEFIQFLSFALGSLAELETQFELARRLGYSIAEIDSSTALADMIGRKLHCLQNSIKARLANQPSVPIP